MATRKKSTKKSGTPRKRRRAAVSGVKGRRRRRRSTVGNINMMQLLGVAVGGALSGFLDKPLDNFVQNPMMKSGIKGAIGVFLTTRSGMIQGVGYGMVGAAGGELVNALTGGEGLAGIPALISGNQNVPALIADEFGYESDMIGEYESNMIGADDDDDDDDDVDELGYMADSMGV